MKTTIVLADDSEILRRSFRRIIHESSGLELVGEATTGPEAITMMTRLLPDICIIDTALPNCDGSEMIREILKRTPDAKIIVSSIFCSKDLVEEYVREGAVGYLLKDCIREELQTAVETVMSGNVFISSGMNRQLAKELRKR